MRAISVPVTVTSGISGFIFPGDRVDLVLSYPVPSPTGSQADEGARITSTRRPQTVLRDVRVIGIDQRLDGKPGEAVVAHTATLEVTPKQGEIIALASEIGKVSLTLRSLVPAPEEGDEGRRTAAQIRGSPRRRASRSTATSARCCRKSRSRSRLRERISADLARRNANPPSPVR